MGALPRRRLCASIVTLCLASSACSDRVVFLLERCDEPSEPHPDLVPIVSLAEGEFVLPANVSRVDDRWLMTIGTYPGGHDLAEVLQPSDFAYDSQADPPTTRTELSEPCGDSRLVARDLSQVLYYPYGQRVLNVDSAPRPRTRWTFEVHRDGGAVFFRCSEWVTV